LMNLPLPPYQQMFLQRKWEIENEERELDNMNEMDRYLSEAGERVEMKKKKKTIDRFSIDRKCTERLTRRNPGDNIGICGKLATLREVPGEKEHRVICQSHVDIIARRVRNERAKRELEEREEAEREQERKREESNYSVWKPNMLTRKFKRNERTYEPVDPY